MPLLYWHFTTEGMIPLLSAGHGFLVCACFELFSSGTGIVASGYNSFSRPLTVLFVASMSRPLRARPSRSFPRECLRDSRSAACSSIY